ncbi:competence protein CoiA family protein [Cellulomonas sp. NTE-D12]|uniref:competence protein CoiA family protein n=1 Tax=Cellulomonas sp. NTE-D12 TaxID=2962632 RepID=UPI0030820AF3|nr:hypothetical protein CELD12_03230 [Cellulomonas sp. NTE-D12]
MGHDPLTLQVFNADADTRMVWAVHRDDPTNLVYVQDDEVDGPYRAWTKEHLACVVPGCTVPLTAAHRSRKRDGFVHRGPVDPATHNPESVLHQQGKAAILAWVRQAYPDVVIDPEVNLEGGQRRPDVLAVSEKGNRIAFEVQYSGLSVELWQSRHDWYMAHDITDVWLFGHTGTHFARAAAWTTADARLNAVQAAVMATGSPVWWINPVDATVAWAGTYRGFPSGPAEPVLVPADDTDVWLTICPLSEARLAKDGLRTDAYNQALDNRYRVQEAERRAEEDARQRAAAAQKAAELALAQAASRLTRSVVRRGVKPISDVDTLAKLWERSSTRARGLELFGDDLERLVLVPYPEIPSPYVGIDHRHWQTAAYLYALHQAKALANPTRVWISESQFIPGVDTLQMPYHAQALRYMVDDWARILRDREVLRPANVRVGRSRRWAMTAITAPPEPPGAFAVAVPVPTAEPVPPEVAAHEQPAPPPTAESTMVRRVRAIAATRARRGNRATRVAPVVDPSTVPTGHCLGCRAPLTDTDLAAGSRRHLGKWGCAGPL